MLGGHKLGKQHRAGSWRVCPLPQRVVLPRRPPVRAQARRWNIPGLWPSPRTSSESRQLLQERAELEEAQAKSCSRRLEQVRVPTQRTLRSSVLLWFLSLNTHPVAVSRGSPRFLLFCFVFAWFKPSPHKMQENMSWLDCGIFFLTYAWTKASFYSFSTQLLLMN